MFENGSIAQISYLESADAKIAVTAMGIFNCQQYIRDSLCLVADRVFTYSSNSWSQLETVNSSVMAIQVNAGAEYRYISTDGYLFKDGTNTST